MRKLISFSLAIAAAGLASAPAAAANVFQLVNPSCSLTTGCLFNILDGNINEQADSVLALETAYNAQHLEPPLPASISLSFLHKTPGSLNAQNGTFTLPGGGLFSYFAIKAGEQFMLYQVAPTNSVNWTTAGLANGEGRLREASFIAAFSGTIPIPEPEIWAMLIAGFGIIGGGLRYRRAKLMPAWQKEGRCSDQDRRPCASHATSGPLFAGGQKRGPPNERFGCGPVPCLDTKTAPRFSTRLCDSPSDRTHNSGHRDGAPNRDETSGDIRRGPRDLRD